MPPSWLKQHRKADLIELANEAGLQFEDGLRRDEMVDVLDDYLQANQRLATNATFEGYYGGRRAPFKPRESSIPLVHSDEGPPKSVVRARGRRTTQVKSEYEDELQPPAASHSNAPLMATSPTVAHSYTPAPATMNIIQRRQPSLPPSPSLIANEIEHAEARAYAGLTDLYYLSGIPQTIDSIREACSSLVAIQLAIVMQEAYFLQKQLLPWIYVFDTPAIHALSIPGEAVAVPDLFVLLTSGFWKPTLLWASTSIFVPLVFAYFFNLTVHTVRRNGARVRVVHYEYDPFMFNVVKNLVSALVYGRHALDGWVGTATSDRVVYSQYAGLAGMLLTSYIGAAASIWEAVQRR